MVERHGLAHRPGMRRRVVEVGDREGRLGLAEALEDGQPRVLLPEVVQVGVERLARGGAVLERREVVRVDVRLHHEAVHRGRAAQRGDVPARDEVEDLVRVEAVEVVGQHARLHGPLAVELAPDRLAPAGVGDREVRAAVAGGVVPELRGRGVCQRVGAVVQDHLGLAGGARREVHDHRLVDLRGDAHPELSRRTHAGVEVDPALALARQLADVLGAREPGVALDGMARLVNLVREASAAAVHDDLHVQVGALGCHRVHHVGDRAGVGADDRLDRGCLQAVEHVVLAEHEGCRDHDRADLVQRQAREPELVVAPEHHEHHVALADPLVCQEVRALVAPELHLAEGEDVLLALGVAPLHGGAVGLVLGDVVDDVVGPVEVLLVVEGDVADLAVEVA